MSPVEVEIGLVHLIGRIAFPVETLPGGAVGYVYDQLTGDSGAGDRVGPFMSRVVGLGPQIGYIFPLGSYQGYVSLKIRLPRHWQRIRSICEGVVHFAVYATPLAPSCVHAARPLGHV
jgi:hypothetical protein